jgi:hypothetical protein
MEDVETGLTVVCVFGSVVNSVIVIPKSTCILGIWIVVILVLAWTSDIIGPSIKGSTGKTSVQMNGISKLAMIDEPDN